MRCALVIAALAFAGCAVERVGLDRGCALNSDCQDALVCADGVCRAECAEARDCPVGHSCVASGHPGRDVCLPPESPALCAYHGDCPLGAYCVERQCRAQCAEDRDCGDGERCRDDGTCERAVRVGETPPFVPPAPDGQAPPCSGGRVRCDGVCVDLASAAAHCGACGRACADGETCSNAACDCVAPRTRCGDACVDLEEDEAHCGACFAACAGPCHEGQCCGAGRAYCAGACADVQTNGEHCGDCGVTCGAGRECTSGACAPDHQLCEGARPVAVTPGTTTVVRGSTAGVVWSDYNGCQGIRWPDVFYTFALEERSLVYLRASADAGRRIGVGFLTRGCDELGTLCSDLRCVPDGTTGRSDGLFLLDAGEARLVVETDEGANVRVAIDVLPIGDAVVAELAAGTLDARARLGAGPSTTGSCAPGGEHVYAFVTCDADPGGALRASAPGVTLGFASADRPLTCAAGALDVTLPPGSGLHAIFVDAPDPSIDVSYRLTGTRP